MGAAGVDADIVQMVWRNAKLRRLRAVASGTDPEEMQLSCDEALAAGVDADEVLLVRRKVEQIRLLEVNLDDDTLSTSSTLRSTRTRQPLCSSSSRSTSRRQPRRR